MPRPLVPRFQSAPAPDGSIYIIDWYDEQECHGQTPAGKSTGRIYKMVYGDKKAEPVDLASKSDEELVKLQLHKNDWHVRHARRLLAERAAAGRDMKKVHEQLTDILDNNPDQSRRLRALWALHVTGGANEKLLGKLLADKDEYIRAWAVQLESEDGELLDQTHARFVTMAESDSSPLVRLYLASALQRLPLKDRWEIAERLVQHEEDKDDHNLPLVYWYGIEPLVPADKARALKLAAASKIPLIRQYIARRATAN